MKEKIIKKEIIIVLWLALISCYGLSYVLKSNNDMFYLSNSILSVCMFVFFYNFYKYELLYIKPETSKKCITVIIVFSALFSLSLVLGKNFILYDTSYINRFSTWLLLVCIMPIISSIILFIFYKIECSNCFFGGGIIVILKNVK